MPLQLNGQNIETPVGDLGTYTWANVLALNSTNIITVTDAHGRTSYIWKGILTLRGTATLNVDNQIIQLCRVSTTQRGQFVVQDSAKINFSYCSILVKEFYVAFHSADPTERYILRNEGTTAEINAYETNFDLGNVAEFNSKAGNSVRTDITLNNIRNVSVQGIKPSPLPSGYEGYFLRKVLGSVEGLHLRNVAFDVGFTTPITFRNILSYAGAQAVSNWDYNGLVLRDFNVLGNPTHDYFSDTLTFTTFLDCEINLANARVMKNDQTPAQGEHKKAASHKLRIFNTAGSPVQNAQIIYTGRSSLTATTDANGNVTEFVLVFQETKLQQTATPSGSYATYPKPLPLSDFSAYTRHIKSYLHEEVLESLVIGSKVGSETNPFQIRLATDLGISQSNTTTVAAYTGIAHTVTTITVSEARTIEEIYDSRKLYWRNNTGVNTPEFSSESGDFKTTNLIIGTGGSISFGIKFRGAAFSGIITLQAARTYIAKFDIGATSTVRVVSGLTNLTNWTFKAGAKIDNTSSAAATVYVSADQISNVTAQNPTSGGGSLAIRTPPATLRLFGIPNVTNAIVKVEDLTTNTASFPTLTNGEATIEVVSGRQYKLRADAPGYLASNFVTVTGGSAAEYQFNLTNFRALYDSGINRAAAMSFDPATLFITISDALSQYSFADAFRTIEDFLATPAGLLYTAHPYPVVLSDRNILTFPFDTAANTINPARIRPNPANTTDPTLLFEVFFEGATDTTYSGFDFTGANGRIIRVRSVVAIASGGGSTNLAPVLEAIDAVPTATENASAVRASLAAELGRIDVATSSRATQVSVDGLVVPDNSGIAAIKAKTDAIVITSGKVVATASINWQEARDSMARSLSSGVIPADDSIDAKVDAAKQQAAIAATNTQL